MTQQLEVHYAVQICDQASYQGKARFCGSDRTQLSKKSLISLFNAIRATLTGRNSVKHTVLLLHDNTSENLQNFLQKLQTRYQCTALSIEIASLSPRSGIVDSIRQCYQWLDQNGRDLVFQVQDDYLFCESAIVDSIDHYFTSGGDCQTQPIIQPFNDIHYWAVGYKNRSTPRLVSLGKKGYWIQIYDTSCSFMTSHWQFRQHWDLYDRFFDLIPNLGKPDAKLENDSLNYMFTRRGVLGLTPINTLSHHIQTQPDLYVDWRPIWDSINENA